MKKKELWTEVNFKSQLREIDLSIITALSKLTMVRVVFDWRSQFLTILQRALARTACQDVEQVLFLLINKVNASYWIVTSFIEKTLDRIRIAPSLIAVTRSSSHSCSCLGFNPYQKWKPEIIFLKKPANYFWGNFGSLYGSLTMSPSPFHPSPLSPNLASVHQL